MIDNCHNNRRYYTTSMLYDVVAFVVIIMGFVFLSCLPLCISREELPLCRDGHDAFVGKYLNLHTRNESVCPQANLRLCEMVYSKCSIGYSAEFMNAKCSIMNLQQSMLIIHNYGRQVLYLGDSFTGQLRAETFIWCYRHNSTYCDEHIQCLSAPHLTRFQPPFTANDTLTKALILYPNTTDIVVTTGNHWGPLKGFINATEAALLYQEMLVEFATAIDTWNPDVHVIWYDVPPPHRSLVDSGPNQKLYNHLAKNTLKSLIKNIVFLNTSEFILERIRLQPHSTVNGHYCQGFKGSVTETLLTRVLSLVAAWLL